jgi:rhamnosyltransferase
MQSIAVSNQGASSTPTAKRAPYVVMRSHNDMPIIGETLRMLSRQRSPRRLLVMENASTDGTRQAVDQAGATVIEVPAGHYVPGRVLNQAMEATDGEFVVFLNSDCTPQSEDWLELLLAGFDSPDVGAVFGRQVPRPDCEPLYALDTEATFGDGERQKYWRHCFSMASSAIRRSVWEKMRFDEALQYSEDIDCTWRIRQAGWTVRYVPDAVVMHSHNYTPTQWYRRQFGEGKAEARIFSWTKWQRSFLRYVVLPWGRQVWSDWKHCAERADLGTALYSPYLRAVGAWGRWLGFQQGLSEVVDR